MTPRDAAILAAYTHPVRVEIVDCLRQSADPLTPAQIGALIGVGQTSARRHLTTLEGALLVRRADASRWESVPTPIRIPSPEELADATPEQVELVGRAAATLRDRRIARQRGWAKASTQAAWASWAGAAIEQDTWMHLTPAQAEDLEQRMAETIRSFRAEISDPSEEGSVPCFVLAFAAPLAACRPHH